MNCNYKDPNVKGYLISEGAVVSNNPKIIEENEHSVKILTGLQDGDVPNRNKRIYSTILLSDAINAAYIQERIKTKSFYGEAGHPLQPDIYRQLWIDQTRISHIVDKIWMEGNVVKGIVESANTTVGRDFRGLIRQESAVAFSMRGVSPISEKKGGYLEVKAPLSIFAYDWVIHPSHTVAYLEKVISESTVSMLTGRNEQSLKTNSSSDNLGIMSESGIIVPFYENQIISYLKDSSKNYKQVSEQFEFDNKNNEVTLSENGKSINIKEGKDIIKVYLEDYISQEIDNFLLTKI